MSHALLNANNSAQHANLSAMFELQSIRFNLLEDDKGLLCHVILKSAGFLRTQKT